MKALISSLVGILLILGLYKVGQSWEMHRYTWTPLVFILYSIGGYIIGVTKTKNYFINSSLFGLGPTIGVFYILRHLSQSKAVELFALSILVLFSTLITTKVGTMKRH